MGKRTDQASDKFVLRLPDGMRALISEMAERHGRSMNAEIVAALATHIAHDGAPIKEEMSVQLAELGEMRSVLEEVRTDMKSLRVFDLAKELLNKMVESERLNKAEKDLLNQIEKDPPA
jgi:plasmid stability protein